jgi:hypothetical protein
MAVSRAQHQPSAMSLRPMDGRCARETASKQPYAPLYLGLRLHRRRTRRWDRVSNARVSDVNSHVRSDDQARLPSSSITEKSFQQRPATLVVYIHLP